VTGAPLEDIRGVPLAVDQACGLNLTAALDERRGIAARTGRLEDRVALGALLADLGAFGEADLTRCEAQDVVVTPAHDPRQT
jgi:hypothetical protein